MQKHWRGIAQGAIAATAVVVSVASLGSLSGVSLVLAAATIGALSSQASYYAGCMGTESGCSVTGALTSTLVGGITSGASAGLGDAFSSFCDSFFCSSAFGISLGTGVGAAGYSVASALQGTCLIGAGAAGAAEAGGLDGFSLNQHDWNRLWGIFGGGLDGEE